METLQKLQSRVSAMLKLYAALQADKQALEKKVKQQTERIEKQDREVGELKQKLETLVLQQAGNDLDEGQKAHFKQQIDQVIAELDKNLELLK